MGARANAMTDSGLRAKWRGKDSWLSDGGSRGAGRLVAKLSKTGAIFYFSYFDPDGRRRFLPIGPHDSDGRRGKTLQAARDRAAELSQLLRNGAPDLHVHFERQRAAEERARKAAEETARRSEEAARRGTLGQLLSAYVAHLEREGKQSAGDVRRIFDTHVYRAAPDLSSRKASEIPVDEFVGLIGAVAEAGKGRTAAKLRSYLRAAYSLAIRAKTDPSAPLALRTFGIVANPLASIDALSKFSRARKRNLSADELRYFLKRLDAVPAAPKKDALSLCLLLGGQRPIQLLRAKPVDVDLSAETITLYDSKGSRKEPREHVVPLTRKAGSIARRILDALPDDSPHVFTNDGKRALREETVSAIVSEISASMLKAKEAREGFQLRDIRRTCETMLAALGVSSDVRAQLQSHGLGGVQARHYDRHDYALEKRAALEKWQRHLDGIAAGKTAKVLPIKRAKGRGA